RRTRNAEKISAKTFNDDTASPKRKDVKYTYKDNNDQTAKEEQLNNIAVNSREAPMKLRGGRVKTADISQYLEKNVDSETILKSTPLTQANDKKEITDENACKAFQGQLSDASNNFSSDLEIKNNLVEAKKTSNNNNIFLQEPVLHLNFAKVSSGSCRTLKMMHNSFLTHQEVKPDLFSTPSQPKINSIWKEVTRSNNIKCTENEKQASMNNIQQHILDLSKPTQVTQIDSTTTAESLLNDEDNSCDSGDSGVVILSGTDGTVLSMSFTNDQNNLSTCTDQTGDTGTRKKPATPHRILCPSPAKNSIMYLQSPPGLLSNSSSGKSRNKRQAAIKSRKRLICKDTEKEIAKETDEVKEIKPLQTNDAANASLDPAVGIVMNINIAQQNRQLIVEPANSRSSTGCNKKITEFYPIRRSVRKTKKEVQVERDRDIEKAIREEREDGLKIEYFDGKGRGIVTTRPFTKGEFVVEYIGDLISVSEAKQREQLYAKDDNTAESGKLGRLVNHSRNGNLVTKTVPINNRPHLVLIAKEDIEKGVEVTYDYGDRSKESLQHYPWLAL
uniref:[histone H4]-lysine(20) N-methyltransferase n=1 Tax=Anopheles christyi TaxID=43041 RepID=A0A182K612_9DIPT